jgi:hypothetical protein
MNTPTSVNYIIGATCIIIMPDDICFSGLKKQVHGGLTLLLSQYKFTIKAHINTSQLGSGVYYHSLFCIFSDDIWELVKIYATPVIAVSHNESFMACAYDVDRRLLSLAFAVCS